MDPFVGEIKAFPYDFVPECWLFCDGSQVSATQYQALYSVICGLYGGYSNTYFTLPDLRQRVPVCADSRNSLFQVGKTGGTTQEPISIAQLGQHNHQLYGDLRYGADVALGTDTPGNNVFISNSLATPSSGKPVGLYAYSSVGQPFINTALISSNCGVDSPVPHNNMMPYLAFRFCICCYGTYPVRN
ncbi:microcystin-dependent protein [Xylanibacter oryzae DSM 17970]|uniref:Microcystin-dependent protein n=1 Tax=Xylanibacter oryzae DSM 17970 TaxID=915438 RepID=A0ABP3BE19_9BACT|nr:tail fiber protein [Xylanibacter oryzae]EXG77859.1 microcystin-dependent protein [Xylanibacter oryzae DSM 17970]